MQRKLDAQLGSGIGSEVCLTNLWHGITLPRILLHGADLWEVEDMASNRASP